jgi:hypothetical protein
MSNLHRFKVRLTGRGNARSDLVLLAENASIAIYRAATLALEVGARDFEMLKGPRFA